MKNLIKFIILLLIFIITSCRHNKDEKKTINGNIKHSFVLSKGVHTEMDSCGIKRVILYVEDQTCISCIEETLYPIFSLLVDSFPNIHPLLIIHDDSNSINVKWNDQYKKVFRIVDSNIDSIRILNNWIPQNHVYYGFLLDSINNVEDCGFLYNNKFIQNFKDVINEEMMLLN